MCVLWGTEDLSVVHSCPVMLYTVYQTNPLLKNYTQGRRETWRQRLGALRRKYVSESRSPVSTALTWCKFHIRASCGSYIRRRYSHHNGRKQYLRDNNGEGQRCGATGATFYYPWNKNQLAVWTALPGASSYLPPPTPFFRWYLLRPTDLFSDYISSAAMARDRNASRVCR